MNARIGSRLLASLKPRERPFEVCDSQLAGFRVRVQPSGVTTFLCTYRNRGGVRHRVTIGRHPAISAAQARDEAYKILGEAATGIDPSADRKAKRAAAVREKSKHTLESFLANEYLPAVSGHLRTANADSARLRKCFASLTAKKLETINQWTVEKWRGERLRSGLSAATVNRDVATLSVVLGKAVEWGILEEHPLRRLRPAKVNAQPIVRYLDEGEEKALRAAMDQRDARKRNGRDRANCWREQRGYQPLPAIQLLPFVDHLKPMVLVSINTGVRRGELSRFSGGTLTLNALSLRYAPQKQRAARCGTYR